MLRLKRCCCGVILVGLLGLLMVGCTVIPAYEQGHLAKPQMQFSDSSALAYESKLVSGLEPGTDTTGGASASGCTACQ